MNSRSPILLGVNIDHVATIRQARGTRYPEILEAAQLAVASGANSITIHLREDRRHIQDRDVELLTGEKGLLINLEIALTEEMIDIACKLKPEFCCLVPEKREELTTEGGLDVAGQLKKVTGAVSRLHDAGIQAALFIDPEENQLQAATEAACKVVELHTGTYADANVGADQDSEVNRLQTASRKAAEFGLKVHAGHGLTVGNVGPVAAIPQVEELNIGHAIVARALFVGLGEAVVEMNQAIRQAEAK